MAASGQNVAIGLVVIALVLGAMYLAWRGKTMIRGFAQVMQQQREAQRAYRRQQRRQRRQQANGGETAATDVEMQDQQPAAGQ